MIVTAVILSFTFGIVIGSFLNVVVLRLPHDKKLHGRSMCPHCKHLLHAIDLVPIFSFLQLRGRCRYCGTKLSSRYLNIELVTGLLFALAYITFPATDFVSFIFLLRILFVISVLLVVFIIDYEHFLILDSVILSSSVILFALSLLVDSLMRNPLSQSYSFMGVLSGIGLSLFFWAIYAYSKGRWMGFGDVKFAFLLGMITPFPMILLTFFLSVVIGGITGIYLILFRGKSFSTEVPFGVFLSLAAFVVLFQGQLLVDWYLRVIGVR